MRSIARALLLLLPLLLLGGCSDERQVENQAYVIAMGLDRAANGGIEISVQLPKIGGSGSAEGEGEKGGGDYLKLSVEAQSYQGALERLGWAIPRKLNLSQIKLIVFSRELAAGEDFRALLQALTDTEQLFAAANVAISEGSAKEFVFSLEPTLGTRLAAELQATLEHYQKLGVTPDCSLAELYFYTNSIYSDPLAGYVLRAQDAKSAAAPAGSAQELLQTTQSQIESRYLGAAVFAEGRLRGVLSGEQAVMANLIGNSLESFRYLFGGEALELSPMGQCHISVDTGGERAKISISMNLSISSQTRAPDVDGLRESLKADMLDAIEAARRMGADVFGFADAAARNFLTRQDFINYNWRSRFQDAQIEIRLRFSHADA